MGTEGILIRADPEADSFRCANCFYYEKVPGSLDGQVCYCNRRERMMGWNPVLFYCTEYGAGDNLDEWEERMHPRPAYIPPMPPAPPTFSEFIESGAPRLVNPVQTSLDGWCA